jgi:acyl carrier protein
VLESDGRPVARVAGASHGGRAPEDGTEASVAAVWCEALGLEAIGADEDFFELGGNSLVGLQVLSRLRRMFDVELPLRIFFESRTVAAMAGAIESERAGSSDASSRIAAILDEIESLSDDEIEAHLRTLPAGEAAGKERA